MNRERELLLHLVLYQEAFPRRRGFLHASGDAAADERSEAALREAADKARAEYEAFRHSRAMRTALDKIMPDWADIDASDDGLPRDKWGAFVSDRPDEWLAWLVENGVREANAKRLVAEVFEGRQPRGST